MVQPNPKNSTSKHKFTKQQYARLKAEAASPYRGLRKFVYLSFGASGLIGAFIFVLQLLAHKTSLEVGLPSLALQVGVVTLMIFLWRWDKDRSKE
ncbi:Protein of unknown function (DUF3493) [Rivularia sp. PCC 7116]|uniref:DUF3493 domain-containing protein n=1 Tax=Rivularia sp. PCC 7116 TaxID=373994 RepID=UPI00029F1070|nr:DUF3493 domain-containing protein [Rivularia sp. PCC 7116]AFY53967.1 Protein of unknown function (DUF3493) [Rivularia sp. PCC 7116]